jgi:chromosome segregation ATPase
MPMQSPVSPADYLKEFFGAVGTLSGGGVALWFLGRARQKRIDELAAEKQRLETLSTNRTADQKTNDQLWSRLEKLETRIDRQGGQIQDLQGDKQRLELEIIDLRKQIAVLEVKKAEYESNETIFRAQIAELQERLTQKSEALRCAEAKLKEIE